MKPINSLKSELHTGKLIEIEIYDKQTQKKVILNSIIDKGYDADTISIYTPMQKGRNYPVFIGQKMTLYFSTTINEKTVIYSIKAEMISRKKSLNISILELKLLDQPKKDERRNYFRLDFVKRLPLIVNGNSYEILTKDLSAGGLSGVTNKQFAKDEITRIDLPIDGKLCVIAKIIACTPMPGYNRKYVCRVKFHDLDENIRTKIINYIFSRQAESIKHEINLNTVKIETDNGEIRHISDRRKGPDIVVKSVSYLSVLAWFLSLLILANFLKARPPITYGIDNFFDYYKPNAWDFYYLNVSFYLSIAQFIVTFSGLTLSKSRSKRSFEHINLALMINLFFAIFIMISTIYLQLA